MKIMNGNISSQLSVYHQNIPGKNKSFSEQVTDIELLLKKLNCDVLFITEMDTKSVEAWRFPGYTYHAGHLKGAELVRVSVLVKSSLSHTSSHLDVEVPNVSVDVKILNTTYRLGAAYREWNHGGKSVSPLSPEQRWAKFESAWVRANIRCKNSLLLGDMNFDALSNESRYQMGLEPIRLSVLENIVMRGWKQLITKNTRFWKDQTPACLDHIYCNFPDKIKFQVNKSYIHGDHNCTGVVIRTRKFFHNNEDIISRCWARCNWSHAKYLVKYSSKLYKVFHLKDPNDIYDFIEVNLREIMDIVAPERRIRVKPNQARWLNGELEDRIGFRNDLKLKWQLTGDRAFELLHREEKTEVRQLIREAKMKEVKEDLEIRDSKKQWENIRKLIGGVANTGPPTELVENGVTIKDPLEIATIFNEGFKGKVDGILKRVKADPDKALEFFERFAKAMEAKQESGRLPTFRFREFDIWETKKAIMSLKNTPSTGTDNIPTVFLKGVSHELSPFLTYLYNQILRTGIVPDRFRQGNVSPVFKKGSRLNKLQYRPVNVTNAISKPWERLCNAQINQHLDKHGLNPDHQFSYKAGFGTDGAWSDIINKILMGKDRGKLVALQIWDLQSAFNILLPEILTRKLTRIGFDNKSVTIIGNLMRKRQVRVKIGEVFSEFLEINVGTPEGGILSPGLFNFGLTDFCMIKEYVEERAKEGFTVLPPYGVADGVIRKVPSLEVEPTVYADDSGLVSMADNERELRDSIILTDMCVLEYFTMNGMSANVQKSDLVSVMNRLAEPLRVGELVSQDSVKLLGLQMSHRMSFVGHAHNVVAAVSGKINSITRMRQWAPEKLVLRTATVCLMSHLLYLIHIYAGEYKVQKILQVLQNRIMRAVLGKGRKARVSEMLAACDYLNIPNSVEYWSIYFIRKIDRTACAPYMFKHLIGSQKHYRTRRQRLETSIMSRTFQSSNSFLHRGLAVFNSYNLVNDCTPLEDFKTQVRAMIIRRNGNNNM